MKKHFLVQVEPADETRFECDDFVLRKLFEVMLESVVKSWSNGPQPAVSVEAVDLRSAVCGHCNSWPCNCEIPTPGIPHISQSPRSEPALRYLTDQTLIYRPPGLHTPPSFPT